MNPIRRREDANRRRTNGVGGPKRSTARIGKSRPKRAPVAKRIKKPTVRKVHKVETITEVAPALTTQTSTLPGVRLNKYLADQGLASRREADVLIQTKQILINDKVALVGARVLPTDTVTLVGNTKSKRYIAYYKGRGIITHSPSENEIDIPTRLRKDYGITDVTPVGRLDKDSEGLIILSNDGRITGPLLDSEQNHEKEYVVTVDKPVTLAFCKLMEIGVDIEGYRTKAAIAVPSPKNNKRFNLTITEGKKHQIRRMCAALGYQIESLKRVRILNIEVGALKPNQYRKISGDELRTFLNTLGIS
ncbi:MAG: pseudouridylate synthase specific to ribosomal small subunit, rRNA pseudouridine2604 synthase [Candidatus Parcubacteria bacterium]|jgi:23S rRNA pseudouridine2604 synthase